MPFPSSPLPTTGIDISTCRYLHVVLCQSLIVLTHMYTNAIFKILSQAYHLNFVHFVHCGSIGVERRQLSQLDHSSENNKVQLSVINSHEMKFLTVKQALTLTFLRPRKYLNIYRVSVDHWRRENCEFTAISKAVTKRTSTSKETGTTIFSQSLRQPHKLRVKPGETLKDISICPTARSLHKITYVICRYSLPKDLPMLTVTVMSLAP